MEGSLERCVCLSVRCVQDVQRLYMSTAVRGNLWVGEPWKILSLCTVVRAWSSKWYLRMQRWCGALVFIEFITVTEDDLHACCLIIFFSASSNVNLSTEAWKTTPASSWHKRIFFDIIGKTCPACPLLSPGLTVQKLSHVREVGLLWVC